MGDHPRIDDLRRRVQSDPASIAFAALAEEYRRAARLDDAIATCVTGLKRHPSYLSARVTLGRALMEAGRYEEAEAELAFVLRTAPENLAAIRGLAEIRHRVAEPEAVQRAAPEASTPTVTGSPQAPVMTAPPAGASGSSYLFSDNPSMAVEEAQLAGLEAFLGALQAARAASDRPTT